MPATVAREDAFADLVRNYENQWVAIIDKDDEEIVVASGSTAAEASQQAKAKGYSLPVLFKVPSFSVRLIP